MIRKNWKLLLITSIMMLIPVLAGVILWNQFPDRMPTHWNAAGEVDGWSSKAFAVFGLPMLMLAIQWGCVLATAADPKKGNHPEKVIQLVLWIAPVLSVILHSLTFAAALGKDLQIQIVMPVAIGLLFSVIGNYLPKCKQNYTIGIKISWTLNSEENWNRTHRFAGRLWLAGGIVIMFMGFFGIFWIFAGITFVITVVPVLYSYILYRKGI